LSDFLERIRTLICAGDVRISEHGYDELSDDGLTAREVFDGMQKAIVVEEYADYPKGPCILLLQQDQTGSPIHVVWGIPKGHDKLYGASQRVMTNPWFWLPPIARTRAGGMQHSRGGCNDGTAKEGKIRSRRTLCG